MRYFICVIIEFKPLFVRESVHFVHMAKSLQYAGLILCFSVLAIIYDKKIIMAMKIINAGDFLKNVKMKCKIDCDLAFIVNRVGLTRSFSRDN